MAKDYRLDRISPSAQRRPQLAQDDAWCKEFLLGARFGHVATHWEDQPFITPTTFWYDPDRREIYFHSSRIGRLRANSERHNRVCFETFEAGELLPSNIALEFSIQYQSVIVFGRIRILADPEEKRRVMVGLIAKYFPDRKPGKDYRPITAQELERTSVYAIAIEAWSGKRNWPEAALQSSEWPPII